MPWGRLVSVAMLILLARVAYLAWLCPYDLAADEAQYWDWSRRLDWSYYSKGPAVAWLIACSTRLFGDVEWAVRLPAALSAFASMLLLARFAWSASGGVSRAAWLAMLLFALLPVFYGTSQFMTTDGLYYLFWLATAYTGWRLVKTGRASTLGFLWLGALVGLGMLCKYTILLILPGLLVFLARRMSLTRLQAVAGVLAVCLGMVVCALPIAVWNHQHGWPTVSHLIGAIRLPGGDVTPDGNWRYNPLWTLSYPVYAVALLGPPAAWLLVILLSDVFRVRNGADRPSQGVSESTRYAVYLGLPVFLFYLLVSLRTDVKLNWPAGTFVVFIVPMACWLAGRRESSAPLWRWIVGFGIVAALLISFAPYPLKAIGQITLNGRTLDAERPLARISGFPRYARSVEKAVREIARETGREPFLVASTYGRTALLAFYLTGHPVVYCAGYYRGARESSYDYFTGTDLSDPALLGRPAVLFGDEQWAWEHAFYFGQIKRTPFYGRVYKGFDYRGPSQEPRMRH